MSFRGTDKASRRSFLKAFGIVVGGGAALTTNRSEGAVSKVIDVTVYADEEVLREAKERDVEPIADYHNRLPDRTPPREERVERYSKWFPDFEPAAPRPLTLTQAAIEYAFEPFDVEVDVSIAPVVVEWNEPSSDAEEQLDEWEQALNWDDEIEPYASADANLLLTSASGEMEWRGEEDEVGGIGHLDCPRCSPAGTAGLVFDADEFSGVEWADVTSKRTVFEPGDVLTTAVHEVGHNLGLDHDHGTVVTVDDTEIVTTPMLHTSVYHEGYLDGENQYGEEIVYATDGEWVSSKPQFNEEIPLKELVVR